MRAIDVERDAVLCLLALESMGVGVTYVTDLTKVAGIMARLGKAIGPAANPSRLLLTERNCLWAFAHKNGEPLVGFGVRIDDLGGEDAQSFLARSVEVIFDVKVTGAKYDIFSDRRWGKIAYIGDLKSISKFGLSRQGASIIRYLMAYTHYRLVRDYGVDVNYCFIRASDLRRSEAYGFLDRDPFVWETNSPLYPDGNPAHVLQMPKEKLCSLMASVSPYFPERFAINQKPIPPISV